jgi:hypothetical protein
MSDPQSGRSFNTYPRKVKIGFMRSMKLDGSGAGSAPVPEPLPLRQKQKRPGGWPGRSIR